LVEIKRIIMMIRFVFPALFILVLFVSCGPSKNSKNSLIDGNFKFKEFKYEESEELSKYLNAEISYFQVQGESDIANTINNDILNIYQGMAQGIPDNPNELIDAYMQSEVAEIKSMLAKVGGSNLLPYEYGYHAEVVLNTDRLISYKQEFYEYTGGAHGIVGKKYTNIDVKTGKEIHLTTLFNKDELKDLNQMGEKAFRKLKGIPQSQLLSDAGYSFDDGFVLPINFLILKNGLQFYFAPYDIGPYSMGDANFVIPYDEIRNGCPKSRLFHYID
jgi:hypothetical protein